MIIYIPLKQQLEYELNKHSEELLICHRDNGSDIGDILDGTISKETVANTLCVEVHKKSSSSLWPIYIVINNLPPEIRYKEEKMILVGMHFGRKPEMNLFLLSLVHEMQELRGSGITFKINGRQTTLTPLILACVTDLPAKHAVSHLKSYNAYYGCTFCYSKGRLIDRTVRHTYLNPPAELRTMNQTINHMNDQPTIKDVQTHSPLIGLPGFDIVRGCPPDFNALHLYRGLEESNADSDGQIKF